jgi:hypothetical protein
MAPGQDWCLQCGAGAPGSVGGSWRPLVWLLGATVVLVLGAAAAGYAALKSKAPSAPLVTRTVAAAPAATAPVTPTTTAPTASVPLVKPPKIPLNQVTPTPSTTTTTPTTPANETTSTKTNTSTEATGGTKTETEATPILLDTDAASTYNPYTYPASYFGDPSLAIDGDTSTAWTAQVNPATAPTMAEGLLIDLKSPQKVEAVKLVTATPGMTVQLFGTKATTAPNSITSHEWVALSRSIIVRKRHARIPLKHDKTAFTLLTLWISKAPSSAVGTPTAPGHVSVDELELFPAT